jgi:outer membrane lipase/esterase
LTTPGRVVSPDGLYVVAGGGNNARAALDLIGGGANFATTAASFAAAFAADIGSIVDSLQLAGAEDIIVWNTPNLGLAPALAATPFSGAASFLASIMNQALALRLSTEVGVETFDLYGFATGIAANPGAFGFTNAVDACGKANGPDCATSLFYDGIHPSAAGHLAIAEAMLALAVTPVPEPETYALMLAGLAALGWRARRRSAPVVAATA